MEGGKLVLGHVVFAFVLAACAAGVTTALFYYRKPAVERPLVPVKLDRARSSLLDKHFHLDGSNKILVDFLDLQCPACRASYPALKFSASQAGVQIKYSQFPLRMHPLAFNAAVAYEVALEHGIGDTLVSDSFSKSDLIEPAQLNAYLASHSLPAIVGSTKAKVYERRVLEEQFFGKQIGISATPTLYLRTSNGDWYEVMAYSQIEALAH